MIADDQLPACEGQPMRLTRLAATNFLAFRDVDIPLDRDLVVIVGPNGSGKSTIARAIELVARVLEASNSSDWTPVTTEYTNAGHRGSRDFEVRLSIMFDRQNEQEMLLTWYRAALISQMKTAHPQGGVLVERQLIGKVDLEAVKPLFAGTIVVQRHHQIPHPWRVYFEFDPACDGIRVARSRIVGQVGDLYPVPYDAVPLAIAQMSVSDRYLAARTEAKVRHAPSVADLIRDGGARSFVAEPATSSPGNPVAVQALYEAVGYDGMGDTSRHIALGVVLDRLVSNGIALTYNHRAPMELIYALSALTAEQDVQDGRSIPAALYRLKNGAGPERERWTTVQRHFRTLTGKRIELSVGDPLLLRQGAEDVWGTEIVPVVVDTEEDFEVPMQLAGAGSAEAAFVATVLATARSAVVLDEPATNLSTTAQRRLLDVLSRYSAKGQVILITHSPDLVRIRVGDDLSSVVRLSSSEGRTTVHRHTRADNSRVQQLLSRADVRSILFAAGTVLLEGDTELGALDYWLADTARTQLPSPDERNIRLVNVGGQKAFGQYVEFAEMFGIPWVAFADAPVFASGSDFEKQLAKWDKSRGGPRLRPADAMHDFSYQRERWREAGVFTVATDFRGQSAAIAPGVVKGEVEEWLYRLDPTAYAAAAAAHPGSKPRLGAAFAARVDVPADLVGLWREMLAHLRLL